jgi:hypothetical protein
MSNFNSDTIATHKAMIIQAIDDGVVTDENIDDVHHLVFNTDYFIIGHYQAEQWIANNFDSAFDAIEIVRTYEMDLFGETTTPVEPERIANMLSYICGEEVLAECRYSNVAELREALTS